MEILSPFYILKILQYLPQKYILELLGKIKIMKAPAGFELMTYMYSNVVTTLTHCATL